MEMIKKNLFEVVPLAVVGMLLLIFPQVSLAKGFEVYPNQPLYLPLNSSATITASFDNKPVDVSWTKTNVFGDIGTLSQVYGFCTVLQVSNLPAFGTITAEYGSCTKQVQVIVGLIDIFKRVNERAADIDSFMATCTLSMSIPDLNVNQTQTAELLFKQPDKLKISLYDSSNKRLQTQIFSGKYMTLIDEAGKKYKKDVTGFIGEMNLPNMVFQLDLDGFLEEHDLCFNLDNTTVPLYGIDAVAKRGNGYYAKILFVIDYDKGLTAKREIYGVGGELISGMEIVGYENVDNHWLAKKTISKTTALGYGVINEVLFDEVMVNGEIGDGEF